MYARVFTFVCPTEVRVDLGFEINLVVLLTPRMVQILVKEDIEDKKPSGTTVPPFYRRVDKDRFMSERCSG